MVDRISSEISLTEFQKRYLVPNRPCVFSSPFTKTWKSREKWIKNGKPDFKYLCETFGDCTVPVANCSKKHFNSHEKISMNLKQFLEYWEPIVEEKGCSDELLYLKDWHFQREFPGYRAYEVLKYFQGDWLNEWYDQSDNDDDYRFVYMGPKGTWTAFHADVLRSYSWSANICGKKKWLLYPPGEEVNLKDLFGNLPFDVTSSEMNNPKQYPNFQKARMPIEVIQEAGEIVFVPSCWYHQVHNMEHTISINHNWTNAYGIDKTFRHLRSELSMVEKEISEFKESEGWHHQCQLILKCTAGLAFEDFATMVIDLLKPRVLLAKSFSSKEQAKTSPDVSGSSLSDDPGAVYNCFKRIEITCVPREHLQFDNKLYFGSMLEKKDEDVQEKLSNLKFDIEKLIEAFRMVHEECKGELMGPHLKDSMSFIEEISTFMKDWK